MEYKKYESYKPSGIDWIGDVPKDWSIKRIKHLSIVKRGASPRPIDDAKYYDENGKYSWVRISDVTNAGKYLLEAGEKLSDLGSSLSAKLHSGDLFLSICASVGKPCISKIDCCIHDGFVYFPTINKRLINYLYYVFANGECYGGLGKLGTQLNLNSLTIGSIYIPFYSCEKCEEIAGFLDRETEKIDKIIQAKEKLIELLKEKRQAVITHAVTKGIDPNSEMKPSGIDWIGDIPKDWNASKIRYEYFFTTGWTPSTSNSDFFEGENKWVNISDLNENKIINETVKRISDEAIEVGNIKKSKKGSLLFSFKLSIGQVAIVGEDLYTNEAIATFYPKKKNSIDYLYYAAPVFIVMNAKENIYGARLLNQNLINSADILAPNEEVQKLIADFLDKETAKIDFLISKAQDSIDKMREYKTALITAAVTGKIDVRNIG